MLPSDPFSLINVNAESTMRGVTLALPSDRVRTLLPSGLELGAQDLTPPGTHPVTLFFNDMIRVQANIPGIWPAQTYREHILGIPYTYLTKGSLMPGKPGPYYYMPKLYLDNLSAVAGGRLFWGFSKDMASFQVTGDRYSVYAQNGHRVTSLAWEPAQENYRPVSEYPLFAPVRQMLSQPNISMLPLAYGPFFFRSDFDRDWDTATLCPQRTAVDVDVSYVTGYDSGRYPASGWTPGVDESMLGSYVLRTYWRLSIPYLPFLSLR